MSGKRLELRIAGEGAAARHVLVDQDGDILPGQAATCIEHHMNGRSTVTVTFAVDGKSVAIVKAQPEQAEADA